MYKIAVIYFLGMVVQVSAIVVQDYSAAEAAPSSTVLGSGFNWDYVYNYKGSSAVSVGGGWLLTAGHVADDAGSGLLSIDGTDYLQQEIVYHDTADLALVRYDKVFPGHYDLYTGAVPQVLTDPKLPVLMVGYGTTGTVFSTYWTDSGSGRGDKRWGSQKIDYSNGTGNKFSMSFQSFSTTYEAGVGVGDSGGGVFYREGDIWKLAGINVSRGGTSLTEFNRIDAMSMPYYADWVTETIPEPAAVGLVGFGSIGLFLARAKRRRKLVGRSLFPIRGGEPQCDRFLALDEDADADDVKVGRLAEYTGALFRRGAFTRISHFSPTMERFRFRLNTFSRFIWNHLDRVTAFCSIRMGAVKQGVKCRGAKGLDILLGKVSYDRIVSALNTRRLSIPPALKSAVFRALDKFLDKCCFDKLIHAKRHLKKSIRSAIRKVFRTDT